MTYDISPHQKEAAIRLMREHKSNPKKKPNGKYENYDDILSRLKADVGWPTRKRTFLSLIKQWDEEDAQLQRAVTQQTGDLERAQMPPYRYSVQTVLGASAGSTLPSNTGRIKRHNVKSDHSNETIVPYPALGSIGPVDLVSNHEALATSRNGLYLDYLYPSELDSNNVEPTARTRHDFGPQSPYLQSYSTPKKSGKIAVSSHASILSDPNNSMRTEQNLNSADLDQTELGTIPPVVNVCTSREDKIIAVTNSFGGEPPVTRRELPIPLYIRNKELPNPPQLATQVPTSGIAHHTSTLHSSQNLLPARPSLGPGSVATLTEMNVNHARSAAETALASSHTDHVSREDSGYWSLDISFPPSSTSDCGSSGGVNDRSLSPHAANQGATRSYLDPAQSEGPKMLHHPCEHLPGCKNDANGTTIVEAPKGILFPPLYTVAENEVTARTFQQHALTALPRMPTKGARTPIGTEELRGVELSEGHQTAIVDASETSANLSRLDSSLQVSSNGLVPLHRMSPSYTCFHTDQMLYEHVEDCTRCGFSRIHAQAAFCDAKSSSTIARVLRLSSAEVISGKLDRYSNTVLHYLMSSGRADVATLLEYLEHGVDFFTKNMFGESPLHTWEPKALSGPDLVHFLTEVRKVTSHQTIAQCRDSKGRTIFHALTDRSLPLEKVKCILIGMSSSVSPAEAYKHVASQNPLNTRDNNGSTPGHLIYRRARRAVIETKTDAKAYNGTDHIPADAKENYENVKNFLQAYGAKDFSCTDSKIPTLTTLDERKEMYEVVSNARRKPHELLKEHDSGRNVVQCLAHSILPSDQRLEFLKWTISARVYDPSANASVSIDLNAFDKFGNTALHSTIVETAQREDAFKGLYDCEQGPGANEDKSFLMILLRRGDKRGHRKRSSIGAERREDKSFKHIKRFSEMPPSRNESLDIVEIYIKNGADINMRNRQGKSPLHLACYYGLPEFVSIFLEHKANIHARDNQGIGIIRGAMSRKVGDGRTSSAIAKCIELVRAAGGIDDPLPWHESFAWCSSCKEHRHNCFHTPRQYRHNDRRRYGMIWPTVPTESINVTNET